MNAELATPDMLRTLRGFVGEVVRELRWRLLGAVMVSIALAFAEGAGLVLLIPLLQLIGLAVDESATGGLAGAARSAFAAWNVQPTLTSVLAVFVSVSAAHALLYRKNLLLHPELDQRFARALRGRLYSAIVNAEWSFFITRRTTDLVHAVTAQVDRVSNAVYQLLTLISGIAVTVVYVAIAFRLSPLLTGLVSLLGAGMLVAIRKRTRRSSEMGERYTQADREQFQMAAESIAGLKVAKTLGAERRDAEIFSRLAANRTDTYLDMLRSFALSKFALDLGSALLISALLYVAVAWLGLRGAGLLVLIFIFARIMPRVMSLQESFQIIVAGLPAYRSLTTILADCEAHAEHVTPAGSSRLPLRREVALREVYFSYPGSATESLSNVSLEIRAGATTAIVGASGAGKSTLADVLIGLVRPQQGRLAVDGHAITAADTAAWRRSIGYVPQESFLLHDTIRANLLWAKPTATDDEMWDALERASAAAFVRARPEALDSIVGDRGVRLSGGERQRLALARALLTAPALLVLVEATSALDSVNEELILRALGRERGRLTTVIITHRLSAIRDADVIHVLDAGQLLQSGTWASLSARDGAFAKLLAAQEARVGSVAAG
jgi:ATP-binding cassette subfamily C protein